MPISYGKRQKSFKIGGCKIFTTLDLVQLSGRYRLGKKIGRKWNLLTRQDCFNGKICLSAYECDSHISEIDVTGTNKSNKEVWELVNVLRGQRGVGNANH